MSLSVSYSWSSATTPFQVNSLATVGNQAAPAVAPMPYFSQSAFIVWDDGTPATSVEGAILDAHGMGYPEMQINTTSNNAQYDAAITIGQYGLLVTFTDTSVDSNGDIRGRTGGGDFLISGGTIGHDVRSSVAGLSNGNYVVTWTRQFSGGDNDIDFQIVNTDETMHGSVGYVDTASALNTDNSSVAGLANGGFVVAYEQSPKAGGATSVYFRQFDNAGNPLAAAKQIDSVGSNSDIHVLAMKDGGFAVSYTDSGYNGTDTDISFQIFNADGTSRSNIIRANTSISGDQSLSSMTELPNGFVVVGWNDAGTEKEQVFDTNGVKLGSEFSSALNVIEGEIVSIGGGQVMDVRSSTVHDEGGDHSIQASVDVFIRTSVGNAANDIIVTDGLRDVMTGGGGADTFVIKAASGSDIITDFAHGIDKIDLSAMHVTYGELLDHASSGGSVIFDFNGIDSLRLNNITKASLSATDFTGLEATRSDFDGAGYSDILWRSNTGDIVTWDTVNGNIHAGQYAIGSVSTNWQIVDVGDFSSDSKSDFLWRSSGGETALWTNVNGASHNLVSLSNVGTNWNALGTADFDADGKSDILWQSNSGDVVTWSNIAANGNYSVQSLGNGGVGWHIVGSSDLDGDRKDDLLWRSNSGDVVAWTNLAGGGHDSQTLGKVGLDWHIVGTGDFNSDGEADILWRSDNGDVVTWTNIYSDSHDTVSLGNSGANWKVQNTGDFNADGKTDIVWRGDSGDVVVWENIAGVGHTTAGLGHVGPEWNVQQLHYDFV